MLTTHARHRLHRALGGLGFVVLALARRPDVPACADAFTTVRGVVVDRASGAVIAGATVRITRAGGGAVVTTTTRSDGTFAATIEPASDEHAVVHAFGYDDAAVSLGAASRRPLRVALTALEPVSLVRTTSRATASSAETLGAGALAAAGALRVADQLQNLPGVTFSGDALAPGGDAYLSLRGLRPSEGQALLNGHPFGPIGAAPDPPDADGTVVGFDFQDAPLFALRSTTVTFGAEATPAFGIEAIGGAIDLDTLLPTRTPETSLLESVGDEGRRSTALRATGTSGAVGYALAYGVSGTYGLFPGAAIAQTGLRGTDLTSATLQELTYPVSGDYLTRNGLLSFTVALRPAVDLRLTAYDATSEADKTGEGDDDFDPYAYTLANAPIGATTACPHGVAVQTDAGSACETAAQYAQAASGPAGGGPGATQALRNQDEDATLHVRSGRVDLHVDAFTDRYALLYDREASAVDGPQDVFFDRWQTTGGAVDADVVAKKNDLRGDVAVLTQRLDGDASSFADSTLQPFAATSRTVRSADLTDAYAPNARLSLRARAFASSDGAGVRFEPALRVALRATARDTIALDSGRTSEDPSLDTDRVQLAPIGALNPDCGAIAAATPADPAFVDVGTGPAPGVRAESATDLEIDEDHAFGADDRVRVALYGANVANRIATAQMLAGPGAIPSSAFAPLAARIASFCGASPRPGAVAYTLSQSFNAASATLRGIELSGHDALAHGLTLEYACDLQTIVLNGIPASVLRTDATLVNGAQAFGVPRMKATLGLTADVRGFVVEVDGHAVAANNPQQLPAFAYADASLSKRLGAHASVDVQAGNVFDSHAQRYGLIGLGVPYATNPYYASLSAPFVQPNNERYGLAPASVTASTTLRL